MFRGLPCGACEGSITGEIVKYALEAPGILGRRSRGLCSVDQKSQNTGESDSSRTIVKAARMLLG
jgi:hypothetical protein